MSFIDRFPRWLHTVIKRFDFRSARITGSLLQRRGWAVGYSPMAFLLPIPLYFLLAFGPLVFGFWRGIDAVLILLAALSAHLVVTRFRKRRLPKGQLILLVALAVAVFFFARDDARTIDRELYRHVLLLLVPAITVFGMAVNRWWADVVFGFGSERARVKALFQRGLASTQLFTKEQVPDVTPEAFVTSVAVAILRSPALVLIAPSLLVVVSEWANFWAFSITLAVTLLFLGALHFSSRLGVPLQILRQLFLTGGAGVVTWVVILLAVLRLARVQYVATILDTASWGVLSSWIVSLYLAFWLYEYWVQRARAEVLLGLLHPTERHPLRVDYLLDRPCWQASRPGVEIHGAGRLIAVRLSNRGLEKAAFLKAEPRPNDPDLWYFESYRPLDLFTRIADQLSALARTGRERRSANSQQDWQDSDAAETVVRSLQQRDLLYQSVPALLMALAVGGGLLYLFGIDQKPGAVFRDELAQIAEPERRVEGGASVDAEADHRRDRVHLVDEILGQSDGGPAILVAASGGGTRAALWSYAVLRELRRREQLDQVVLLSGVSGGSLGIAYFAAHREALIAADPEAEGGSWQIYRCVVAEPFIEEVLAGATEWRFLEGHRFGELLAESFERRFVDGELSECAEAEHGRPAEATTLGEAASANAPLGLLFNSSIVGSWQPKIDNWSEDCAKVRRGSMTRCATSASVGGRLVFTNLAYFDDDPGPAVGKVDTGWPLTFPIRVARDPDLRLSQVAALSANFPPVFSNVAVDFMDGGQGGALDGEAKRLERFWITDGGAVENRGIVILLRALRDELEAAIVERGPCVEAAGPLLAVEESSASPETASDSKRGNCPQLPDLQILVAEASGAGRAGYAENRGIGAKFGAATQLANTLVEELLRDVERRYRQLGGPSARIEVVYVPMPDALRRGVGTHWMLQPKVVLEDPANWYRSDVKSEKFDGRQLLEVIDAVFLPLAEREEALRPLSPEVARWLDRPGYEDWR